VPPVRWIDGPYPGCAEDDCGRLGTHYYLAARTGARRYGCERRMRQRRVDPEHVAYVVRRDALRPGPTERPGT
jgi:hypothetical protein